MRTPDTRSIPFDYSEGDIVAKNATSTLLINSKGIMYTNSSQQLEQYHNWESFLKRLDYLLDLEQKCNEIHEIVEIRLEGK